MKRSSCVLGLLSFALLACGGGRETERDEDGALSDASFDAQMSDDGGSDAGESDSADGAGDSGDACAPGSHQEADACVSDNDCPQGCSGRGTCSARACSCDSGYTGPACAECAGGWMVSGTSCVRNNACPADACNPGAVQCNGDSRRACTAMTNGCGVWGAFTPCVDKRCICPSRDDAKLTIQQWGQGTGNNALNGLATAPNGDLFGTGAMSRTDMTLMSAAFVGDLTEPPPANLWWEQWGDQYSAGNGLAIDSSGALYVAATFYGPGSGFGLATLTKWASPGQRAWTATWDSQLTDAARAVALGPTGDLVVAGDTEGIVSGQSAGGSDAFLSRVAADGRTLWTRQWGTGVTDGAYSVAVDTSGAIYVAGTLGADAFCRKVSAEGQELWTVTWSSPDPDAAFGVALAEGGVIVVGQVQGAAGSPSNTGSFVSRVSSAGVVLWTEYFTAPGSKLDAARGVIVSSVGEVYIAGQTWGELVKGSYGAGSDVYVQKRNLDGVVLWTKQVRSPGTEEVAALAISPSRIAYVAGRTTRAFPGFPETIGNSAFLLRVAP